MNPVMARLSWTASPDLSLTLKSAAMSDSPLRALPGQQQLPLMAGTLLQRVQLAQQHPQVRLPARRPGRVQPPPERARAQAQGPVRALAGVLAARPPLQAGAWAVPVFLLWALP